MIWPWNEIARWKKLAEHHDARADAQGRRAEMFRAEYLNLAKAMRGAHRGIWRLKQKLKKHEKEQG